MRLSVCFGVKPPSVSSSRLMPRDSAPSIPILRASWSSSITEPEENSISFFISFAMLAVVLAKFFILLDASEVDLARSSWAFWSLSVSNSLFAVFAEVSNAPRNLSRLIPSAYAWDSTLDISLSLRISSAYALDSSLDMSVSLRILASSSSWIRLSSWYFCFSISTISSKLASLSSDNSLAWNDLSSGSGFFSPSKDADWPPRAASTDFLFFFFTLLAITLLKACASFAGFSAALIPAEILSAWLATAIISFCLSGSAMICS